jgi:hypothetical protein
MIRSVVHTESPTPRSDAFYGETYPPIVRVRDKARSQSKFVCRVSWGLEIKYNRHMRDWDF